MAHDPSAQLHADLHRAMQHALSMRRPVLHHLNADASWLFQIPRPESAIRNGSRIYYNILIDPWFTGGQTDISWWFSLQHHAIPSSVKSIAEVEELIRESEILTEGTVERNGKGVDVEQRLDTEVSLIDAVAVSHEFTDHCHEETLRQVHPDTPVFTIKKAAKLMRGWNHFRTIVTVPVFDPADCVDWKATSIPPLPAWIGISRLEQKSDPVGLHAALMITFNGQHLEDDEIAEALIHTPHGISERAIGIIVNQANPPIRTLALLHGLYNVRVGNTPLGPALQINLGAQNGVQVQQALQARYWFATHDEIKKGSGIVARMIKTKKTTLDAALAEEKRQDRLTEEASELVRESFAELGSGESRVLK